VSLEIASGSFHCDPPLPSPAGVCVPGDSHGLLQPIPYDLLLVTEVQPAASVGVILRFRLSETGRSSLKNAVSPECPPKRCCVPAASLCPCRLPVSLPYLPAVSLKKCCVPAVSCVFHPPPLPPPAVSAPLGTSKGNCCIPGGNAPVLQDAVFCSMVAGCMSRRQMWLVCGCRWHGRICPCFSSRWKSR